VLVVRENRHPHDAEDYGKPMPKLCARTRKQKRLARIITMPRQKRLVTVERRRRGRSVPGINGNERGRGA